MHYKIEDKKAFTVIGIKEFMSTVNGENMIKIPQMWENLSKDTYSELLAFSDREPYGLLGLCNNMYDDGFDYWIAVATTKHCPEKFSPLNIPASTWAIFEAIGPMPTAIQKLWNQIYTEWFPTSGYEHALAPEIEWYPNGDPSTPNYKSEIWIPVLKK